MEGAEPSAGTAVFQAAPVVQQETLRRAELTVTFSTFLSTPVFPPTLPLSTTRQPPNVTTYSSQLYQTTLDRTTPHTLRRWGVTGVLFVLFFIRILWAQAYYIVCYGLGIYLLNLFLAFLQPKFDPSLAADIAENDVEEGAPGLPTSSSPGIGGGNGGTYGDMQDGEFRPFIRRLPEFHFWHAATRAVAISIVMTLFPFFDIPVFWPILLVYFCVLFVITMRRQIGHMRKYRYLPFDIGRKTQYGGGAGGRGR